MTNKIVSALLTACLNWFLKQGIKLSTILKENENLKDAYLKFDDIGSKALVQLEQAKILISKLQSQKEKDDASDKAVDDFFDSLRPR